MEMIGIELARSNLPCDSRLASVLKRHERAASRSILRGSEPRLFAV
jgi:hypothetical protein